MPDVKFFSVNLLLCFCCSQLYNGGASNFDMSSSSTGNADNNNSTNSDDDPNAQNYSSDADVLMTFLFNSCQKQLRSALSDPQCRSETFSACLAVQLVRGLILCATSRSDPNTASASASASAGVDGFSLAGAKKSILLAQSKPFVHSAMYTQLVAHLPQQQPQAEDAAGGSKNWSPSALMRHTSGSVGPRGGGGGGVMTAAGYRTAAGQLARMGLHGAGAAGAGGAVADISAAMRQILLGEKCRVNLMFLNTIFFFFFIFYFFRFRFCLCLSFY
jgi:hypothetical protein